MRAALLLSTVLLAAAIAGCGAPSEGNGVTGRAMQGPTCPGPERPGEPACADKPYEGRLVVLQGEPGTVVKEFRTGADGRFNVTLAPGIYRIATPEDQMLPRCQSRESFTVQSGRFAAVDVDCDTGIR